MFWSRILAVSVLVVTLAAGCGGSDDNPTATSPPAAQPSPTSFVTPTATTPAVPSPTATPSPTAEPTPSPTPTTTGLADPAVYHDIFFNGLVEGEQQWNLRLYAIDADGSDRHPLTTAPNGVWEALPAPSPDGTRVAFMRGVDGVPDLPEAEVRVIDIETGQETLIVTGVGLDFNWTLDSRQIVFTWYEGGKNPCCGGLGGLVSRIVMVNADGTDFRVLTEQYIDPATGDITEDLEPRLSPDGQRLFFLRTRSTSAGRLQSPAILDVTISEVTEFELGDLTVDYPVGWTPDGQAIAFVGGSRTDVNAPHGLYLLSLDGSGTRRLTSPNVRVSDFVFSPDGSRVAVAAETLLVMTLTGAVEHEFPIAALISQQAWSPDGTRIALIASEPPGLSLRVVTVDTGEVSPALAAIPGTQLLIGVPVWRPTVTVAPAADHGWSDDTLRAVMPGSSLAAFPNPHLDFPWFAWSRDEYGSSDELVSRSIVARHLETGEEVQIASGPDVSWQFAIDDGVVVWEEGGTTLHATNLVTGNDVTTDVQGAWLPRISGRWVVWSQMTTDDHTELMAWDIWAAAQPFSIATSTGSFCSSHDVSGDRVAWVDCFYEPYGSRLTVHDIVTGETVRMIEHDGVMYPLDLHGSTLVYVKPARDWFSGDPATIVVEDLGTGESRELQAHVNTHEGAYRITTDGRFIIFEGQPSGFDLELNSWFDLPVDGHSIGLDNGRLLWAIDRGFPVGPTEIHLASAHEFSTGLRSRYFPETDAWLSLAFLRYWEENGGLPVFGYPYRYDQPFGGEWLDPLRVRWTERQRLECHPERAGTVYEIQLGRLGAELLDQQGRDWRLFPTADLATPHYFAVTGHAIAPEFWNYWSSHGLDLGNRGTSFRESVALFGYPLSEPMLETNADGDTVLTQYFERAVFEYHPDNPTEHQVLLRRLGMELLAHRGQ